MNSFPKFEKLFNTRDLGGLPAAGGKAVRGGMLVRSGCLAPATATDCEALAALVSDVVDLRTERERAETPDPELGGVAAVSLPVLASLTPGVTREAGAERRALDRIKSGDAESARRYMCALYRGLVTDPFCLSQYAKFLRMAAAARPRALLWHCSAGKDRAGVAAILVEKLLGVAEEAIRADYLASNEHLEPEVLARLARPDVPAPIRYLYTVRAEYYDALNEALARAGGFDAFAESGLGVTKAARGRLRERYLA